VYKMAEIRIMQFSLKSLAAKFDDEIQRGSARSAAHTRVGWFSTLLCYIKIGAR